MTRVSLDADGAVCWSHGCLGNSRWKPFHGTNRFVEKIRMDEKKQAVAVKTSIFLSGIPDRWRRKTGKTFQLLQESQTWLDQDFFQQKHSLVSMFSLKNRLFTSYFLFSQHVMLWFKKGGRFTKIFIFTILQKERHTKRNKTCEAPG